MTTPFRPLAQTGNIPTFDEYIRLMSADYFGMDPSKIPSYEDWVSQYYNAPQTTTSYAPDLETPLPTPRSTISDWYRQYLGRDPETQGLDYWTNAAYGGTSLSDIQSAIQNSEEGRAYSAARPRLDVVYNADGTVYNPLRDKGGVYNADGSYSYRHDPNKWTSIEPEDWPYNMGGTQTPPDLVTPFPGQTGVVGQPVDGTQGMLGTQGQLVGGTQGMLGTEGQLSGQPSDVGFGGSQYGALLGSMYNQYLGRNPEAEGFGYWSNALASGASEDEIRNAIANSPEAQQYAATQAGLNSLS